MGSRNSGVEMLGMFSLKHNFSFFTLRMILWSSSAAYTYFFCYRISEGRLPPDDLERMVLSASVGFW